MKNVLTLGNSDTTGASGIQGDIKTICAHGTYGMSIITSVVACSTTKVFSIVNLDADIIKDQMEAVFQDIRVDAVKLGLMCSVETIMAVSEKLRKYKPEIIVVDPVMVAKTGELFVTKDVIECLKQEIFPMATIVTPNLKEAEMLSEMSITTPDEVKEACIKIKKFGSEYVLVKCGNIEFEPIDVLYDGSQFWRYESMRINTKNTGGAGSTLACSIAANLAVGGDVPQSVSLAKKYIAVAIDQHLDLGSGYGTLNHFYKFFRKR